ncbi:DUF6950 family protein [Tsuneonella sp. HG094]
MGKKLNPLVKRQRALKATMAKYRDRPFSWDRNTTCIHLFAFHARRMGHRFEKVPKLAGPKDALRELKKRGWASVEAMLDDLLTPIPVAMMLPGDVSVLPGDDALGAIVISLGSTAIGYSEGAPGMTIFTEPGRVLEKAWRV